MCGIFGIISSGKQVLPPQTSSILFDRLLRFSTRRGKDATGVSLWDGETIYVIKAPVEGKKFTKIPEWINLLTSTVTCNNFSIIGHTRLATHGTPDNNRNNQPLVSEYFVGIHNGILVNTHKLNTSLMLSPSTATDTESLLLALDRFIKYGYTARQALKKVYAHISGAASVAIQCTHSPEILIATNTGSLYYIDRDNLPFVFASEARILKQCYTILGLQDGEYKINHLKPGKFLSIDCITHAVYRGVLTDVSRPNKQVYKTHPIYPIKYIQSDHPRSEYTVNNYNTVLKQHHPDYRRIYSLRRCTKCILPETMPLISFDHNGVCNFCNTYNPIKPLGLAAFMNKIKAYKRNNGKPDCILAFSGGRDSAYGLHLIKTVLKLNPVAFTYDWGMVTDIARKNQSRITAKLGVEHIVVAADLQQKRNNIRNNILAWLKKPDIGMVTLFMAGDKQAEYYAEQLSRDMNIPLILYCRGNHLEDERFKFGYFGIFDGTPGGVIHNTSLSGKLKMLAYACRQYAQNPAYLNTSIKDSAFAFYSTYLMHHNFVYLWHYLPWEEKTVVNTLKRKYGWETPHDTIATWRVDDGSPPFYNYIYYHLQGFTENDTFRSNQIREGLLDRSMALKLVNEENKPRYEGLQWYFDTLKLNGHDILNQIDRLPTLY